MKTSRILRISFLAAAFGAVLSAQAVNIGLVSKGTFDLTAASFPNEAINESVILQEDGFGPLSTLNAVIVDVGGLPLSGSGTYSGAGGSLNFDLTETSVTFNNGYGTLQGIWNATGGTGTYLDAVGGGTFAVVYHIIPSGLEPSYTTFRGDIEAVPEPAGIAALGVGAFGLLKRRRVRS